MLLTTSRYIILLSLISRYKLLCKRGAYWIVDWYSPTKPILIHCSGCWMAVCVHCLFVIATAKSEQTHRLVFQVSVVVTLPVRVRVSIAYGKLLFG